MTVYARPFVRKGKKVPGVWEVTIKGVKVLSTGERLPRKRWLAPSYANTKPKAEAWGRETEHGLIHGLPKKPEPRKEEVAVPTLAEFASEYLENRRVVGGKDNIGAKPSSLRAMRQVINCRLLPVLGGKRLSEIGKPELESLRASMAGKRPSTINNALNDLRGMLTLALEREIIASAPKIPSLNVKKSRPRSAFYTAEELDALVAAAGKIGAREQLAIALLTDAGLRAGEVRAIRWSDADMEARLLWINVAVSDGVVTRTKGGREADNLPMTDLVYGLLRDTWPANPKGHIFTGPGGGPLSYWLLAKLVKRVVADAAVPWKKIHGTRHGFVSRHALDPNNTFLEIQELARHASLSQTEEYMHLREGAAKAAIRRIDQSRTAKAAI